MNLHFRFAKTWFWDVVIPSTVLCTKSMSNLNFIVDELLFLQERDNMQKSEFLKALSDMWKDFDSRVLRYKV